MSNSCNRLVGGTDGFVSSATNGASVCKLGAGGVLTGPNDDQHTWFWAHFYADGESVLRLLRPLTPRASSLRQGESAQSASTWGAGSRPGTASRGRLIANNSRARPSQQTWRRFRT